MNQITAFFDVRQTLKLHEIQAQIDRDRPQKPKPNKHKPGAPNPNRQNPNRLETPESLEDVEPQGCSWQPRLQQALQLRPRLKKVYQQG
jgi:hypothetical protein